MTRLRLLIVTHDASLRALLEDALRDRYAVSVAETRRKALAALKETQPDVVGLDPSAPDEIGTVRGQERVAKTKAEVRAVRLNPADPPASVQSVRAVREADWVILGPGSWFTSVIPHLLVPELAEAIIETDARRLLTLNVRSDAETKGASAARHLELLAEHAPELRLDVVLVDSSFVRDDPHLEAYAKSLGASLVVADVAHRDGSPRRRLRTAATGSWPRRSRSPTRSLKPPNMWTAAIPNSPCCTIRPASTATCP